MPVTPSGVAAGILVSAGGGALVELYRRRQQRQQAVDEWYREALGLISRVERVGHRTTEYQERTDSETLQSELDSLSSELKDHAASAPSRVPQEARDRLDFLANIATGLVIVSEQEEKREPAEMLTHFQSIARQHAEESDSFPDIDQVNQVLEPVDTDSVSDELAPQDPNVDDDQLEATLSHLSDETVRARRVESMEDALSFPFEEFDEVLEETSVMQEAMNEGMREYVRLWLLEITDDIYDEMEQHRK
jgi:hypothetical protein